MPASIDTTDSATLDWAKRVPVHLIPSILVFLAGRLLAEGVGREQERDGDGDHREEKLLGAGELSERLNLPESWLRNEERLGRIPSIRAGKYVRFNLSEVERSLAERKRDGS